jgi:hypothetical protein
MRKRKKLSFEFRLRFALACPSTMRKPNRKRRMSIAFLLGCLALSLSAVHIALAQMQTQTQTPAQSQTESSAAWAVTIVLPPKVIAGELATLATLGVDGKLAPHVSVDLGSGEHLQTDATGRSVFTVPKTGKVLIARAPGASVAALVDSPAAQNLPPVISVAPVISLHDHFSIWGAAFYGDAGQNRVQINGDYALVLASSPECLEVVPGPKTQSGPATVSVRGPTGHKEASTELVSFSFEPPHPPLMPDEKGWLTLRVAGSGKRLNVVVKNDSPGVIHFEKGDVQEVTTTGGAENTALIRVEAIRSGDFSFHAQLLHEQDIELARRFLEAAEPLAPPEMQRAVKKLASELAHHPKNAAKVRAQLQQMVSTTMAGDFRTVLDGAYSAL